MPRSETPLRSDLFPEISPYASGMLAVDSRHTIYWEQSGNPEGVPVVFLHGGPGAGSAPSPASRSRISRAFIAVVNTALSFAITSCGVRAGAAMPNHPRDHGLERAFDGQTQTFQV